MEVKIKKYMMELTLKQVDCRECFLSVKVHAIAKNLAKKIKFSIRKRSLLSRFNCCSFGQLSRAHGVHRKTQ